MRRFGARLMGLAAQAGQVRPHWAVAVLVLLVSAAVAAWFLLVPGGGSRPTEALPTGALDHFTVYHAAGPDGPIVHLEDQFMDQDVDLGPVIGFAVPVEKNFELMVNPFDHGTCYGIPEGQFQADVLVDNQFGTQMLTVGDPYSLCVPTEKYPPQPTLGLDHYKCYLASGPLVMMPGVFLMDQFQQQIVTVYEPVLFCNPVDKNDEGIVNPFDHLTCYYYDSSGIAPGQVPVLNQFGPTELTVFDSDVLCVPSSKESVSTPTPTPPPPAVDFSAGVVADGCETETGDTVCDVPANTTFTVTVNINSFSGLPAGGGYDVLQARLDDSATGLTVQAAPNATWIWPHCVLPAETVGANTITAACTVFMNPPSHYTAAAVDILYQCTAGPSAGHTITLWNGVGAFDTQLQDEVGGIVAEAGNETLTINCTAVATPTPTPGPGDCPDPSSVPWPVPVGDLDCDGWSSADEGTIGTDPSDECPDDPTDDAWPCDFDMNAVINILDLNKMLPAPLGSWGSSPGTPDTNGDTIPDWSVRRDIVPDAVINIFDLNRLLPLPLGIWGQTCTP